VVLVVIFGRAPFEGVRRGRRGITHGWDAHAMCWRFPCAGASVGQEHRNRCGSRVVWRDQAAAEEMTRRVRFEAGDWVDSFGVAGGRSREKRGDVGSDESERLTQRSI
jgi:hypothetical protein